VKAISEQNPSKDGESRVKYLAGKVLPHNLKEENRMLLKKLEAYRDMEA